MEIYMMLPFEYRKYISECIGTAAQLTPDYIKQFKNTKFLYRITIGDIAKITRYNPRKETWWLYTTISPETFERWEGEV